MHIESLYALYIGERMSFDILARGICRATGEWDDTVAMATIVMQITILHVRPF